MPRAQGRPFPACRASGQALVPGPGPRDSDSQGAARDQRAPDLTALGARHAGKRSPSAPGAVPLHTNLLWAPAGRSLFPRCGPGSFKGRRPSSGATSGGNSNSASAPSQPSQPSVSAKRPAGAPPASTCPRVLGTPLPTDRAPRTARRPTLPSFPQSEADARTPLARQRDDNKCEEPRLPPAAIGRLPPCELLFEETGANRALLRALLGGTDVHQEQSRPASHGMELAPDWLWRRGRCLALGGTKKAKGAGGAATPLGWAGRVCPGSGRGYAKMVGSRLFFSRSVPFPEKGRRLAGWSLGFGVPPRPTFKGPGDRTPLARKLWGVQLV